MEQAMATPNYMTPYQRPTLRGTFFYHLANGGASQSFYAANPVPNPPSGYTLPQGNVAQPGPTNLVGMLQAMKNLWPFRTSMCQTNLVSTTTAEFAAGLTKAPKNPLILDAIRVDNEQFSRAGYLATANLPLPNTFAGPTAPAGQIVNTAVDWIYTENDDIESAFHVVFGDGNGHTATEYFHGVPIAALTSWSAKNQGYATPDLPSIQRSVANINPAWLAQLAIFCNQLLVNGLGFRFVYPSWTKQGLAVPPYFSQGNGTPVAAYYSLPGTPANTYSFLMGGFGPAPGTVYNTWLNGAFSSAPATPPAVTGQFTIIVRGMKQLRVINGRWPCIAQFLPAGTAPFNNPAGYYITVNRRAANYLSTVYPYYDTNGYLAPMLWSVAQPLPGGPPMQASPAQPPGAQLYELTDKKLGRPFFEQRGRARNRVT
jgi:hypothetical protein